MTYRLLKVVCQPVLVSEDLYGNLVEHTAQPIAVTAAEFPAFPEMLAKHLADLNGEL